jgi:quercetin dioxygenase-like cupin family protein
MNPLSQFKRIRILPLVVAPALVTLAAFTAVPARATPGCGFTSTNLSVGTFPSGALNLMCRDLPDWLLITRVRGDSDVYISQRTIQPGGQTGWHTHPGPTLITVVAGTVTDYQDDCTSQTYSAGETFTDPGCGDVHNVVNEGGVEVRAVAVQIVPHGAPLRIDADDPGCAQVPPCPAF